MPSAARVALLGYGLAGSAFHAPFIATTPGLRLAAIVTRNDERRARALRDHPEASVLETVDEVWSNADEFDLVVVAAPNRAHVPLARGSVEAGLPVVVDKPLAPSAAEGSALVDQAIQLFGSVESVYAELDIRRPGAEVDDDVFVALEHVSGVHSHLWMSAVTAQKGPRFRVLGEGAAYTKHGLDVQEDALRAGCSPTEPGWGEEPREHWGMLGLDGDLREVPTAPGSYGAFYEAVAASLHGDALPPVDPGDAVAVLEVLEAARH